MVFVVLASGCSLTRNKAADAGDGADTPQAATAEDARGILAKGGTTASSRYVDPMVSTGRGQMQARGAAPGAVPPAAGSVPMQAGVAGADPSIAGLATEPTGVRAGSFSIFSSAQQPGPAAAAPVASPDAGAAPFSPGSVSASRRSVFSTSGQQQPSAGCGTDAQGQPLSC